MEEAAELANYLPLSFKTPKEQGSDEGVVVSLPPSSPVEDLERARILECCG
jgi:hypothetical protein